MKIDFEKIKVKTVEILILVKDKLVIAGKWIAEKTVFICGKIKVYSIVAGKAVAAFSVKAFNFTKEKCIAGKEKFVLFVQNSKQKSAEKKAARAEKKAAAQSQDVKTEKAPAKKGTKKTAAEEKTPDTTSGEEKDAEKTPVKKELTEEEKELKKEKRKKVIIIIIAEIIILILLWLLLRGIRSCSSSSREREKSAVQAVAVRYAGKGEFDRALDKLDDFIEKYGDDDDIWDLWNKIIDMKKAVEGEGGNTTTIIPSYPDNLQLNFDTSGLSDAMAQINKQAEENRKAMEDLMRLQNSGNSDNGDDSDRAAAQAAAEERRLQEEKRKAEEAELAKQDAELKSKIDAVNAEIQKGKDALAAGNLNDAMKYFNNALSMMPTVPGNPNFGASKESEIAQALLDAAENAKSPADRERLMKEAVNYAEKALKDNPNDSGAHNVLAQNAINNKDYNLAEKELKAAAEAVDDPNRYLYWYNLGKIQYTLKRYTDAATTFTRSCECKNDFAPSRYNLGLTQKMLKNENAALAAFRKTEEIDPRHEKAYLEEARILAGRGDYQGAIEAYKNVLKINNVNSSAAMELGSAYYKRKNYSEAEDSYRRAITMLTPSKDMTLTKYNLSTVLYDAGKVDEAVKYAKEAYEAKSYLQSSVDKANVVYNYALVLDKTGKKETAIPIYKEVLSYNADHVKTKINLGNMYMELNPPEVDLALKLFLEVYQKENNNFEANNNLGSAYLEKEDFSNAIKFYQNAMRLDPKNTDVRANLAKAYAKNYEYDNAKTTYTDLIKMDARNWDAYIELAKVCMQLNDNAKAEEYLTYVQDNNTSYRKTEVTNLLNVIRN